MSLVVTKNFYDWDDVLVAKGTKADRLVKTGKTKSGAQFFNLIGEERVLAVTLGMPPVAPSNPSTIGD